MNLPSLDPVGDWLDGTEPDRVGLLSSATGTARLSARLVEELAPERVDEFVELGLDAEPGMLSIPGSLTRDQARTVLKHPGVVGIGPILGSVPLGKQTSTAEVDPAIEEGDDA